MSEDIAIKVEHVGKTFRLPHDKASSLKSKLINAVQKKRGYELQHALSDINFEVKKGEFFGIVGKNGGGKSTLLKVISGIYMPTHGSVHVNGKLTPFIELGVGFNPELSGRENVFLNGALLGFNRSEMTAMYDDIVIFAELEKFMDQKLKNYSSGMQVRLAFSIAIRAQSDILIMDEVLAVGDAAFQKKCFDVFRSLKKQGRTIVLVTHDMGNVEKFCDRVLIINKGKQLEVTTPAKAASIYARLNVDEAAVTNQDKRSQNTKVRMGSGEVVVEDLHLRQGSKITKTFNTGESMTLELDLKRKPTHMNYPVLFGLAIINEDDIVVCGPNTLQAKLRPDASKISFTIPHIPFKPGEYAITVVLYDEDGVNRFDYLEKWLHFSVVSDHLVGGLLEIDSIWEAN